MAKSKVTSGMIAKVLQRNADEALVGTPEGKLILAIIINAFSDADKGDLKPQKGKPVEPCHRAEARRFFVDGRLDYIATLIGLTPQFVREIIGKVRPWILLQKDGKSVPIEECENA